MNSFVKIKVEFTHGLIRRQGSSDVDKTMYLNTNRIIEVCDLEGATRLNEEITKKEYDKNKASEDHYESDGKYYVRVPTVEIIIYMHRRSRTSDGSRISLTVQDTAANVIKAVENAEIASQVALTTALETVADTKKPKS